MERTDFESGGCGFESRRVVCITRVTDARRPFSVVWRVGLPPLRAKKADLSPESLRRRGFEPHRMHMNAVDAIPDGLEHLKATSDSCRLTGLDL